MISIHASDPLVTGSTSTQRIERPSQYSHVINAVGGFWSATIAQAEGDMDDWIANGIARDIQVYNDALDLSWAGIVNQIDAVYGNLTVTVGPLLRATNRLNATFSTVDTNPFPPTEGVQAMLPAWLDDAGSQALYGVLPDVISVGETNPADAAATAATYLAQHRLPATTQVWATGAGATPSLTIHCLGYVHWLFYVYNMLVAGPGTINTDAKIIDILTGTDAATGNLYNLNDAWLPFGTGHVDTPAAPAAVPAYEYEDRTAWELIQGLTARGDTNQNRWLFGIYENQEAYYQQAPTTVEYEIQLSDPAQRIMGQGEIKPWDVRPGKWALFTDFLVGQTVPANLQEDPRAMFIESVTYTTPNTVTLTGDPEVQLSDVMASFGLGGVGV